MEILQVATKVTTNSRDKTLLSRCEKTSLVGNEQNDYYCYRYQPRIATVHLHREPSSRIGRRHHFNRHWTILSRLARQLITRQMYNRVIRASSPADILLAHGLNCTKRLILSDDSDNNRWRTKCLQFARGPILLAMAPAAGTE